MGRGAVVHAPGDVRRIVVAVVPVLTVRGRPDRMPPRRVDAVQAVVAVLKDPIVYLVGGAGLRGACQSGVRPTQTNTRQSNYY